MRYAALASIALALTTGCLRFGYAPDQSNGVDSGITPADGSVFDSGYAAEGGKNSTDMDAAVRIDAAGIDAEVLHDGGRSDGSAMDASDLQDASTTDAQAMDSGTSDSGMLESGTMDSGTTDAGSADSGTTDSGTTDEIDPRWTEDCPGDPSVLFCDDFEDGLLKWSYPVEVRGSTAVTTAYKHAGSSALMASTSASTTNVQSQARRSVKAFGHRKSGDLWARYYYYLPGSVTLTDKFSTGVISEYEDPFFGFSVMIFPDGVGLESRATSRKVNTTTFPRDQWVCVEMHVQVHASAGLFEFYINGTHVTSLSDLDTLPDQGYTIFDIGVHYANFNQGAITTYSDDVVLGTRRIGCN